MTKTSRCSNKDMYKFTTYRTPFKNNNDTAYGDWINDNVYVVYSYGHHFPMYLYDANAQRWYGNTDKYSNTTSRHQTQARPAVAEIEWAETETLTSIVAWGGVVPAVAERIESALTAA